MVLSLTHGITTENRRIIHHYAQLLVVAHELENGREPYTSWNHRMADVGRGKALGRLGGRGVCFYARCVVLGGGANLLG